MNTVVVYDSKYGNTELIARAIAERLAAVELLNAAGAATYDFSGVDLLVVGGPTQAHGVSPALRDLLERALDTNLSGVSAAAFDTRLRMPAFLSGSAARGIADRLRRKGARLVVQPESFIVTGERGPLVDGEVERARAWATAILTQAATSTEPAGAR